jgi:hypothetical protein
MLELKAGAGVAAALLLSAIATPAMARERLAVLMVAGGDPALADDLTEVAIAVLAEGRDRELVGMRELRGRLAGILPEEGLGTCLDEPECLARIGVASGAERAVVGRLHPSGDGHRIDLSLIELRTAVTLSRVSASVPGSGGIDRLVAAIREVVSELLAPAVVPVQAPLPLPAALAAPAPASAPAATALSLAPVRQEPARPGRWVPYAGIAATALAAISFSAAAVTGTIAREDPVGSTRALAQDDLERRKGYATAANGLMAAGVVLSAAACAAFVWWWQDARAR